MRYAFLIALREYLENAKTKGFWIGILLFPVMLFAMTKLPALLEKTAVPTRYFALVDQSGQYETQVEEALDRDQARQIARELFEYMKRYAKAPKDAPKVDFEKVPAKDVVPDDPTNTDPEKMLEKQGINFDSIATEVQKMGPEQMIKQASGYLREDRPPFVPPRQRFVRVALPVGISPELESQELVDKIKPYLLGYNKEPLTLTPYRKSGKEISTQPIGHDQPLFAFVLIPKQIDQAINRPIDFSDPSTMAHMGNKTRGVEFWCINQADTDLSELIQRSINEEVRRREYETNKVDRKLVNRVQGTSIEFSNLNPKKKEGEEEVSVADKVRQWTPVALVYLLWVSLMTVAQMLLNNTIEEKSNRIVEVLLSSVTPGELMMGKMLGIASVGLTMISAWTLSFLALFYFNVVGEQSKMAMEIFRVVQSSGLLPMFFIYFIFGYLMYAGIFLAMGSVCNTLKEAQNMMGPSMLIMMVPLITMFIIPKEPNGALAQALSWVPFYSPFIMMNRAAADPPMFDIVGTFVVMTVFTIFILWLSGKIFRLGILRTGQPPKLLELFRWLRT